MHHKNSGGLYEEGCSCIYSCCNGCILALPIWAESIVFHTRTPEEEPYIYFEMGSNDRRRESRYHDAANFIIYEFPCPEGSNMLH